LTSRVGVKSTDVGEFHGGLLHTASEGQIRAFEVNLAGGMLEDNVYESLAETMRYARHDTIRRAQHPDVRPEL
jgi:hypothetical protein